MKNFRINPGFPGGDSSTKIVLISQMFHLNDSAIGFLCVDGTRQVTHTDEDPINFYLCVLNNVSSVKFTSVNNPNSGSLLIDSKDYGMLNLSTADSGDGSNLTSAAQIIWKFINEVPIINISSFGIITPDSLPTNIGTLARSGDFTPLANIKSFVLSGQLGLDNVVSGSLAFSLIRSSDGRNLSMAISEEDQAIFETKVAYSIKSFPRVINDLPNNEYLLQQYKTPAVAVSPTRYDFTIDLPIAVNFYDPNSGRARLVFQFVGSGQGNEGGLVVMNWKINNKPQKALASYAMIAGQTGFAFYPDGDFWLTNGDVVECSLILTGGVVISSGALLAI